MGLPAIGLVVTFKVTQYTADCSGCSGIMANGERASSAVRVVAASKAWPLGTCVDLNIGGRWVRYEVADRLGPDTRRQPGADRHLDVLVKSERKAQEFGEQAIKGRRVDCGA